MEDTKYTSKHSVHADGQGISRTFDAELTESVAVLERFIQQGSPHKPIIEVNFEGLATKMHERTGRPLEACIDVVQDRIAQRVTSVNTIFPLVEKTSRNGTPWAVPQPVYFDLDGEADAIGRNWGLNIPGVAFGMLLPSDSLYCKGRTEAIAVYFDPAEGIERRTLVWNGQPESIYSDWDSSIYQGVCRTFPSYQAMKRERAELVAAIRTLALPTPTDEGDADPYQNNLHLDDPEYGVDDDGYSI